MRHSGSNIHGINVPGTTAKYKGVAAGLGGDPLLSVRFVLSPVLGDFSPFVFNEFHQQLKIHRFTIAQAC